MLLPLPSPHLAMSAKPRHQLCVVSFQAQAPTQPLFSPEHMLPPTARGCMLYGYQSVRGNEDASSIPTLVLIFSIVLTDKPAGECDASHSGTGHRAPYCALYAEPRHKSYS